MGDVPALIQVGSHNSSAPSWDIPEGQWGRDSLPEMVICVVTCQFMAVASGLGLDGQGLRRKEEVWDISLNGRRCVPGES